MQAQKKEKKMHKWMTIPTMLNTDGNDDHLTYEEIIKLLNKEIKPVTLVHYI